ncbi:hypothetical protein [Rhizobium leguminosarum]|uniref:hypothetical protein n=1 Tax=Rhizobium leguminosarum TaxID=384 RepID=UPI00103920B1|nr:hypothetical protein [Rhizobium leguminosarum]MBY5768795.1 hypothetical protein [Rhizobium leguminosarum]MBY5791274.1 hypothetical protein [Rhizobium leguminosarum]TBZ14261.1 hypothetical protein E0H38_20240 [Rhizobium leguminosarum bv. viciae]TBZ16751.1 hypothetical protein E0H33_10040 [Rhizobium leguminosarum bv. viciae]
MERFQMQAPGVSLEAYGRLPSVPPAGAASTISFTCFGRPWQTAMAVIAAFLARSPCNLAKIRN